MGVTEGDIGPANGLELADAIELVQEELLKAGAAAVGPVIQLRLESVTMQLNVTATRSQDGKTVFKVPIVELAPGGGADRQGGSE